MGEIPPGKDITQRDLIEFMTRVNMSLEQVTRGLGEFKLTMKETLEEMTDRVDASADGIREDFTEKIKALEKESEQHDTAIKSLDDSRTYQKAWIAGAMAVAGAIGGLISYLLHK